MKQNRPIEDIDKYENDVEDRVFIGTAIFGVAVIVLGIVYVIILINNGYE